MRHLVVCAVILFGFLGYAEFYDPHNPNPTQVDIDAERRAESQARFQAMQSSGRGDTQGWMRHSDEASRHQQNAQDMEQRMQDNNRRQAAERARLQEEDENRNYSY